MNQRPKDYCQILLSHYSPPLYQPSYQWNLIVEMTLFSYKICYFLKLSLESSTGCTYPDLNQSPKYYSQSLVSRYSPPLYELSYQWNVSDSVSGIEMKILPCKMCHFFFKLLVENSTGSTEPDLNQRHKDYCQILISNYSAPLYQLSCQWNLSDEFASTELKLLPYKIFYFFKYLAENSNESTEPDLNQRPKDYCQTLISHYSPLLYQLSYQWNLSYEDPSTEMKLLPYKI